MWAFGGKNVFLSTFLLPPFFFFKYLLILEMWKGGREMEKNINLACTPTGDRTHNLGMFPDWNWTGDLLLCETLPNQPSHTSQGWLPPFGWVLKGQDVGLGKKVQKQTTGLPLAYTYVKGQMSLFNVVQHNSFVWKVEGYLGPKPKLVIIVLEAMTKPLRTCMLYNNKHCIG